MPKGNFLNILHGKSYIKKTNQKHRRKSKSKSKKRRSRRKYKRSFGSQGEIPIGYIVNPGNLTMQLDTPHYLYNSLGHTRFGLSVEELIAKAQKARGPQDYDVNTSKQLPVTGILPTQNSSSSSVLFDDEPESSSIVKPPPPNESNKSFDIEDKAMKFSDFIDRPDQYEYILYVFTKNPKLTTEQFVKEISEGKHPNLLTSINNPSFINSGQPQKQKIGKLLTELDNIKYSVPPPPITQKFFEDVIGDVNSNSKGMDEGRMDLARNMALYSHMTNTTKPIGKDRVNQIAKRWGYELGMDLEDINNNLIPFLREMIPLMEEPSRDWNL